MRKETCNCHPNFYKDSIYWENEWIPKLKPALEPLFKNVRRVFSLKTYSLKDWILNKIFYDSVWNCRVHENRRPNLPTRAKHNNSERRAQSTVVRWFLVQILAQNLMNFQQHLGIGMKVLKWNKISVPALRKTQRTSLKEFSKYTSLIARFFFWLQIDPSL